VLRARVHCDRVSVIPNAVDTAAFTPDPSRRSTDASKYLAHLYMSVRLQIILAVNVSHMMLLLVFVMKMLLFTE